MFAYLLLLAAPQVPAAPQAVPATTPGKTVTVLANPTPPSDKLICTREVPVGSMFAKKVCRTAAQRAAATGDSATALDRVRAANGAGLSRN